MILLLLFPAASAMAKEPATPEMSVNDAVAKALANDEAVKKAESNIARTEFLRDQRKDNLDVYYTPAGSPNNPQVESAWANWLTADLNWQSSKKSLAAEEDTVALAACNKYWELQAAIGAVKVAEEALKQANLDLSTAKVSQRVGLITTEALLGAEKKQIAAKASLDKAKNDLETAYREFNQMVGLWPEDRPVLTEELTYAPMENTDVDYLVTVALNKDPSIWLANKKVEHQESVENLMFASGAYTSSDLREIETEQVKLDYETTKKAIETKIRNMFFSALTMEESYSSTEQDVKLAEENLRVVNLKFQLGMATKAEVAASEYSLAAKKQALLELKKNHAYLKLALQKPWAY